jgi:outer membrane protein insertion porin family
LKAQPKSATTIYRKKRDQTRHAKRGAQNNLVRDSLRRLLLGFLTAGFALLGAAGIQAQMPVAKIIITNVGPQAVSESLVRANIRVQEGDPYNRTAVDDDIRNLYATGYFYTVRVADERTPDGVVLTYILQGKLRVTDIRFTGNKKFSVSKLRKRVKSKVGEPLDERKLFADAQEIKKAYQKSGYSQTDVRYSFVPDEDTGRAAVTFEITETPKVKISDVEFVNAKAFSQRKLRKTIKTRRRWMMSWLTGSGVLKEEQLQEDKEKLAEHYRNAGYIDFELRDVKYIYDTPNRLRLQFIVREGTQYRVGAVSFKGVTLFPTNDIRAKLKMGVGEIFTPKGLMRDVEIIQDTFGAKGYIDVMVLARRKPNVQTGTMDLLYEVEEGNKSYIEKIEIKGNTKTKDRVIRRELSVAPGEVFDMVRVKRSRQRLEGTQFFERVDTHAEPTDVPDRKNLVVAVDERNTGNVALGAGFNSVDSLLGFLEYTQGNFDLFNPPYFMGGGQKMRLRAQVGAKRQDYEMTFIEPWFLGRKLDFSLDLYHRELRFVSRRDFYDERRTGARFGLTRALGSDFLIGGVSYTIENIGIFDVPTNAPPSIQEEEGDRLVSKIGLLLAYDTRNSVMLPDRGQRTEFRAELAGGPLGADTDFYKFELTTHWFFKGLFEGHVLEVAGGVGVVERYDDSDRVPLFDRWFLGGINSLRGYRYRDVGPKEFGEPIGGRTYWVGSVEYSVPIIERLRFAVFYDIGMVYEDAFSFTQNGETGFYNDNWGVGVRLNIPHLGPLRLDYGIPIKSDSDNESSGRFQFSVGYIRPF